ncbi:hypothetical protein [Streptomyces sp. NPDC050564]|uniref:hypothetical protein n=1 Tax=Streptomyces sp. NPDC050564 TaxID=3365631 RepID=UPI00378C20F8
MRTGTTTMPGMIAVVVVSVTGLLALTGCGLQDHRDSVGVPGSSPSAVPSVAPKAPLPSGRPLGADARVPSPSGVDGTDATEVSEAWAEVAYGYDTKYDSGPHDAVLRSARWFTAKKAAAERSYRPASGAGNDWNTWAGHKAWTTVDVTADDDGDGPVDTAVLAYRALFVEGTAHGRDGWTGTGPRANVYLKLTRAGRGQPWHVDEVTAVEAAVPPSPSSSSRSPSSASSSSSSLSSSSTPS